MSKLLLATVNFRESRNGVVEVGAKAILIGIRFLGLFPFVPGVDIGCIVRRATSGGCINCAFVEFHCGSTFTDSVAEVF